MSRLFGKKLRYLRKQCGMSQRSFAELLGLLNQSSLSNLESGRRPPSLDLVIRASEQLHVPVDYFICDSIQVDTVILPDAPIYKKSTSVKIDKSEPYTINLGIQFRLLRQSAGLTQAELAQDLGLNSHAHISFLESNQKDPSIELLLRIAERFNVTVDSLVKGATASAAPN